MQGVNTVRFQMRVEQRGGCWGAFKRTDDLSKQGIMEHLPVPNNTVVNIFRAALCEPQGCARCLVEDLGK